MADERRAAAIREYQKTLVQHKEIETQSKKCAWQPGSAPIPTVQSGLLL